MAIYNIPPSIPYVGGFPTFADTGDCPGTPRGSMPFYLDWSLITPQSPTFEINFANAVGGLQQINSLYVDNSLCHQGIYVLFPDTGFRLIVPAFRRGVYPVLTSARRFYVGIFVSGGVTNSAMDRTVLHALNWSPPAYDGDTMIRPNNVIRSFDPAVAQVAVTIGGATSWHRLREFIVQLSGITNGAAPFTGTFQLLGDGTVIAQASVTLLATEWVDSNVLIHLNNQTIAAQQWAYNWTIAGGPITSGGTTSGTIVLTNENAPTF